jgi:glycosyltransferase involved in cell wall biosynthesis
MYRLLSKQRFDLVISQQYQANSSVAAAGFFKPYLVKYAVFHGIEPVSARSRKWFYSTIGRRFTRFICVSEAQCRNIMSRCALLPDEKFSVIHNVINIQQALEKMISREEARKSLGLLPEDFVVGTISRLTWKKRPLDILYAFKEIEKRLPEGKLLIIGTGEIENRIVGEAERLGLSERLVQPGYINEAWRFMRAFDVFVLPSEIDSCPLVLLEAMCAKVPITAADAQGIPETLNGAGYLYETGNFRDLAERLMTIYRLSDQEKMQIVDAGFKRVDSEFGKEVFQERLVTMANHDLEWNKFHGHVSGV